MHFSFVVEDADFSVVHPAPPPRYTLTCTSAPVLHLTKDTKALFYRKLVASPITSLCGQLASITTTNFKFNNITSIIHTSMIIAKVKQRQLCSNNQWTNFIELISSVLPWLVRGYFWFSMEIYAVIISDFQWKFTQRLCEKYTSRDWLI